MPFISAKLRDIEQGEIKPTGGILDRAEIVPVEPLAPKLGFMSRISRDLKRRGERFAESTAAEKRGEQTALESGLQLAGETVGGIFDIGFEGLVSVGRTIAPLTEIDEKIKAAFDTPTGQAALNSLNKGVEKYMDWREKNPRAARNFEAVFEVLSTLPILKGAKVGVEVAGKAVPVVREVARVGAEIVEKKLTKQQLQVALDVTRVRVGELTVTQRKEILKRGGTETKESFGGLSRKEVITVTDEDRAVARSVADVVEGKGASNDIKAIKDKIGRVSEEIDAGLSGNNTIFNQSQLKSRLGEVRDKGIALFKSDKKLVEQYDDLIDFFLDIQKKHPNNLTGLLAARKEFDIEVTKQFPNIFKKFDGTNDGRIIAFANIRRQANDIIADALPEGNPFKAQLKEQNRMFDAIDNIALKASKELETGLIERALKAIDAHGIRTLVISGSLLGLNFLTSPVVVLSLLAGGATIKIAGKVFKSQAVKKAIIKTLRTIQTTGAKLNKADQEAAQKTIALLSDTQIGLSIKDVSSGSVVMRGLEAERRIASRELELELLGTNKARIKTKELRLKSIEDRIATESKKNRLLQ